jgi:hypothetical protein
MKLATIALASAFALSSTFALATTHHKHKSGARSQQGTVGMSSGRSQPRPPVGSANNRGGLVGGADPGTYKP